MTIDELHLPADVAARMIARGQRTDLATAAFVLLDGRAPCAPCQGRQSPECSACYRCFKNADAPELSEAL